jgi:lipoyl(octanoyl) transferase
VGSELRVIRLGLIGYEEAARIQQAIASARAAGNVPDTALVLEHPPVYTRGRRTTPDELPMGEDWYRMQGIDIVDTDRGGRLTYHGPGQLVVHPILNLSGLPKRDDVHALVADI